jgi:hypothetical protein
MDAALPSSPSILFEPLRLGLMSEIAPRSATEPGCSDRVETTGSLTAMGAGMPMQFMRAMPLPLAPRLTLIGFSRAGCPVDSVIGGGLTYVVPLRPSVFFVTSAGALLQPAFGQRRLAIIPQARADVVFDRGEGRSWSVGVRTNRAAASPSLTFGGIF